MDFLAYKLSVLSQNLYQVMPFEGLSRDMTVSR